jgi:hypothetical protein
MVMISKTKIYTKAEVDRLTAGGDSYIRTKDNEVKGIAITREKNPEAPKIIVVGVGPKIKAQAELLAETAHAIPTFVKLGVDQWQYRGDFRVIRYSKSTQDIELHRKHRAVSDVEGIIFMEKVEK